MLILLLHPPIPLPLPFLLAHLSRENNTPDIARQTAVCGMQMAGVENAEDYILQVAPIENLTGGAITF